MNAASVAAALGIDVTLVHPSGGGMVDLAAEALMLRLGIRSVTWPSRPDPFPRIENFFFRRQETRGGRLEMEMVRG